MSKLHQSTIPSPDSSDILRMFSSRLLNLCTWPAAWKDYHKQFNQTSTFENGKNTFCSLPSNVTVVVIL